MSLLVRSCKSGSYIIYLGLQMYFIIIIHFLLAEVFPFYAELMADGENGVFSHKVKLFSASRSAPDVWQRTYYRINPTSLLLETTEVCWIIGSFPVTSCEIKRSRHFIRFHNSLHCWTQVFTNSKRSVLVPQLVEYQYY